MARHERGGPVRGSVKFRLTVIGCAAGSLGSFALAYVDRADTATVMVASGVGLFVSAFTVIMASASFGPRPLRSFGVGAWLIVAAIGAVLVWTGRGSNTLTGSRWVTMAPLFLVMGVGLVPLGLWMMIRRPEQNWRPEQREERARLEGKDGS